MSVEPETERKGDSCASAITVTAGVDVGHSAQGNRPLNWMVTKGNAFFVFVPPVYTCVRPWAGCSQEKF